MNDEEHGGGASRSTEAAQGSSAATDVSLREFQSQALAWLDRHMTAELAALRRETHLASTTADKAIDVASVEAKERLDQHNGLIQKMESQSATFVSREVLDEFRTANDQRIGQIERMMFRAMGGIFVIGLIGIANLVKVWAG